MPRGRKIQLAVLSVFVLVLSIVVVSLLTRTDWVPVPGTGDATSTAEVYEALIDMGIPTKAEGGRALVPRERLGDAQMRLQQRGLLSTTNFNTDILDGATGFGITDSHARLLADRQTGQDLRTQLMLSPRIQNALIIVNSGEVTPFRLAQNTRQASASVWLTLRGDERLSQTDVQVIADTVRTAIPGIEYENINITDTNFRLYRIGDAGLDIETVFEQREMMASRLRSNMEEQVYQMLAPVFGFANLRVQPYVRLNFDEVTIEKIEFFPPIAGEMDGIVRSMEEIHRYRRSWMDAEGIPGTDSNNMGSGAPEYPWGTLDDRDVYREAIMSNNYDINQTVTQIQQQNGVVEALSIAININSEAEGIEEDYTEEIRDLVSKAIGATAGNISIHFMPFIYEDTSMQDWLDDIAAREQAQRTREMIDNIMMYVVIVALGVMVMLLVRSVVRAVKPPPEPEPVLLAAGPDGIDLLIDDDESDEKEYEDVTLTTKSPGLEQIERFIDKDAVSVAQLLRNWLSDE
jgi:flagellar M-ring protein FliF